MKKVIIYDIVGEVDESLPDLTEGRYGHACGKFVSEEGISVSFSLSVAVNLHNCKKTKN